MKFYNRKFLKYASLKFDANFYYHYKNGEIVAVSVTGSDLPVNGFVTGKVFKSMYLEIKRKEAENCNIKYNCSNVEKGYIPMEKPQERFATNPYLTMNRNGLVEVYEKVRKIRLEDYPISFSEYEYNYLPTL